MEANKVKEAIGILYDMELHNYKMTRTIGRLNYEISCLGNPKQIQKPKEPQHPSLSREPIGCLWPIIATILGIFVGGFVSIGADAGVLAMLFNMLILFPAIGCGLTCGIDYTIKDSKRIVAEDELYQKYLSSYNANKRKYLNLVQLDEIRVEKELREKAVLEAERNELIRRRQKAEEFLAEFYLRMDIDKKFRSLIPISKMHEIISLGITTEFYGENGLNDRVRRELREDAFYVKLDEISQKLDTIISKTDRLYGEILNLNSQCETLISATKKSAQIAANNNALLNEAVKNTEIAAYNSERIAAEQRYQSFMMTYRF